MLIGRDRERRLIEGLLEQARGGVSSALVVRGEAGIGKTAVLDHVAGSSALRTLRCVATESEQEVTFAGLEQLLRPLHPLVERLPEVQAVALRSALGLSGERVEDRLLLGLATLNLLAEATEEGPLVCIVDDLQWVDGPSAQAMLFAARRLDVEGVVMLFSVRDDREHWFEARGLKQVTLGPLSQEAAREVVRAARGSSLTLPSQRALLEQAAGNPLALLELPVGVGGDVGASGLEASFRARVAGLSQDTRALLLLAAAGEPGQDGRWSDLARLGELPPEAREQAAAAGLIGDTDVVAFRHPLARSAVYNACSTDELAAAHRALATAAGDPVARALHLAVAAAGPDEALAKELEAAASVARRRGAFASAAGVLERSAELSGDSRERVRRLIAAAQAHVDAGNPEAASVFAQRALAQGPGGRDRAALAAVTGALELQRGTPAAAYEVLVSAAHAIAAEDPERALDLEAQALTPAFVAGWPERAFGDAHGFLAGLPPTNRIHEPFLRTFLAAIVVADGGSRDEALARLRETVAIGPGADDFLLSIWAAIGSAYLGDLQSARELSISAVAQSRAAGSFSSLPIALLAAARVEVNVRSFEAAEEFAREGLDLTRQLSQHNLETCFSGILVRCLAARGEEQESRQLGEETLNRALAHGLTAAADDARLGVAELELSLGHGGPAREMIEAVAHPLFRRSATPMLIESELLAGDGGPDPETLAALDALGESTSDRGRLAVIARTRALLATSTEAAEPLFLQALSNQHQRAETFERARTQLAYGEHLRRAQRRTDARVQLRNALATFEGLNTPLWAERARAELRATGITARKRDPSTIDDLTPQELRIARLVAAGATNRAVANQLFLSPKTVEYHLRKVFLKLGVSSRVELAHQPLAGVGGDAPGEGGVGKPPPPED
jgi:DNA-binding CsgD family transcriptional regulator